MLCDLHISKGRHFLAYDASGILNGLKDMPLTLDFLRLVSAKLRSVLLSHLPTYAHDDNGVSSDDHFAILFLCSFSRSNLSACWPRICKTLILRDPSLSRALPSDGNILSGLYENYMHIFDLISGNRLLEVLQLLQPLSEMISSSRRSHSLGFDTSLLQAVSMAPSGWSLLHHAAHRSSKDMIVELIHCGISVNVIDSDGRSPVHVAAISMNVDVIDYLVERYGGSVIKQLDRYGKTPLDLLVETLSLSEWMVKVSPRRLLPTVVRLVGDGNSLWTVPAENSSIKADNDNRNNIDSQKKNLNESCYYDESCRNSYDNDNINNNKYNDNSKSGCNSDSNSNSNYEIRNQNCYVKDSGAHIWNNTHASVGKKRILQNKLFVILSGIRGCDDEIAIPIVEITRLCPPSLWNIPVVMQSIFLAVRQRRYNLLSYLLKYFSSQLFQHLEYVSSLDPSAESSREENFLEHCLTLAVQNNSSLRTVVLLLKYGTMQLRERTCVHRADSSPTLTNTFLHMAVLKSAFPLGQGAMSPGAADNDHPIKKENDKLPGNKDHKSEMTSSGSSSGIFMTLDGIIDKREEAVAQSTENIIDFSKDLRAHEDERLMLGERGPLILKEILKNYRQENVLSLFCNVENSAAQKKSECLLPIGDKNYNSDNGDNDNNHQKNEKKTKQIKTEIGNILEDFPSIWSPLSDGLIIQNLQFLSPLCLACLTGCPVTVNILLDAIPAPRPIAGHTQDPISVLPLPLPQVLPTSVSCDDIYVSLQSTLDFTSTKVRAFDLNSNFDLKSRSTSPSTSSSSLARTTNCYLESTLKFNCHSLQDNPIVCCALSLCSEGLLSIRKHLGNQLFSELCGRSYEGVTALTALLHLIKAQATYRTQAQYQGHTSSSSSSFFPRCPSLERVKLDQSKVMKTVDILLEAHEIYYKNLHLPTSSFIKCQSDGYPSLKSHLSRCKDLSNDHDDGDNNSNNVKNDNDKEMKEEEEEDVSDQEISIPTLWGVRLKSLEASLERVERRLFSLISLSHIDSRGGEAYRQEDEIVGGEDTSGQGAYGALSPSPFPSIISRSLPSMILKLRGYPVYQQARNIFYGSRSRWNLIQDLLTSSNGRHKLASQMRLVMRARIYHLCYDRFIPPGDLSFLVLTVRFIISKIFFTFHIFHHLVCNVTCFFYENIIVAFRVLLRTVTPDRKLGQLVQSLLLILDSKDVILSDGLPLPLVRGKEKCTEGEGGGGREEGNRNGKGGESEVENENRVHGLDALRLKLDDRRKKPEEWSKEQSGSPLSSPTALSNQSASQLKLGAGEGTGAGGGTGGGYFSTSSVPQTAWKALAKRSGISLGPNSCKPSRKNLIFEKFCTDLLLFSHPLKSRHGSGVWSTAKNTASCSPQIRKEYGDGESVNFGCMDSRIPRYVLSEASWRVVKDLHEEFIKTKQLKKVKGTHLFNDLIKFFSEYVAAVISDGDVLYDVRGTPEGEESQGIRSLLEVMDLEERRQDLLQLLPHVRRVLKMKTTGYNSYTGRGTDDMMKKQDRDRDGGKDKERRTGNNGSRAGMEYDTPLRILLDDSLPPLALVKLLSVYQSVIEECIQNGTVSPLCGAASSMRCGAIGLGGVERRMLTQEPSQILDACVHSVIASYCDETIHFQDKNDSNKCDGSSDVENKKGYGIEHDNNSTSNIAARGYGKSVGGSIKKYHHDGQLDDIHRLQNILLSLSSLGYWEDAKTVLKSMAKLCDAIRLEKWERRKEEDMNIDGSGTRGRGVKKEKEKEKEEEGEIESEKGKRDGKSSISFSPFHCCDIIHADNLRGALLTYKCSHRPSGSRIPPTHSTTAHCQPRGYSGYSKSRSMDHGTWTDVRISSLFPISTLQYAVMAGEYSFLELLLLLFPSEKIPANVLFQLLALSSTNDSRIIPKMSLTLVTQLVSRVDPGSIPTFSQSLWGKINSQLEGDAVSLMVWNMLRSGQFMVPSPRSSPGILFGDLKRIGEEELDRNGFIGRSYCEGGRGLPRTGGHGQGQERGIEVKEGKRRKMALARKDNDDDRDDYELGAIEPQFTGNLQGLCVRYRSRRKQVREIKLLSSSSVQFYENLENVLQESFQDCSSDDEIYIALMDGSCLSLSNFISDISNLNKALPVPQSSHGVNHSGHTLLHEVALINDKDSILSLLEMSDINSDFEMIDRRGTGNYKGTAIDQVCSRSEDQRNLNTRKAFITNKLGLNPLTILIHNNHIGLVNKILSHEIDSRMIHRGDDSHFEGKGVSLTAICMDATAVNHRLDIRDLFPNSASVRVYNSEILYRSVRDRHLYLPCMEVSIGSLIM